MAVEAEISALPAKPEIERSVLGPLLLNSDLWKDAAQLLRPDDFSLQDHQRIFRTMLDLGHKHGGFDDTLLAKWLAKERLSTDAQAYLTDLQIGALERRDIKPLCDAIREKVECTPKMRHGVKGRHTLKGDEWSAPLG